MIETLSSPGLKTVLIEINFDDPQNLAIVERLTKLGWRYSWQQLRINREVKFTVEKIKSYQERGVGGLNYIFYRDPKYDEIFARLFDAYTPGQPLDVSELVKTAP
jgi:hypothetical protein